MSFRFSDLKKTVRKTKDGYQVAPVRLEGRPPAFKIEFLLQQFEGHIGCARRLLDPDSLLDFIGDARLGRGLLATLAQWYRMRGRIFAEVLPDGGAGLRERGIAGPIDLRAWLYTAVNRGGKGYLDPEAEALFWPSQARALGARREMLQTLMLLDRPDEAVLVRTGPAPAAADVMMAYNARAHTTLLRSATEVTLHGDAPAPLLARAAGAWADPLGVEWRIEGATLFLLGRADALGCWTRHGRQVERVALELLAMPELATRELRGKLDVGERRCRFRWNSDTLALLGAARGGPLGDAPVDRVATLAAALRRERDRGGERAWSIRRAGHLVGVAGGVFLPHLELRDGDLSLYLRLTEPGDAASTAPSPFHNKTPVVRVAWSGGVDAPLAVQFPGEAPRTASPGGWLSLFGEHLDALRNGIGTAASEPRSPVRRAA